MYWESAEWAVVDDVTININTIYLITPHNTYSHTAHKEQKGNAYIYNRIIE